MRSCVQPDFSLIRPRFILFESCLLQEKALECLRNLERNHYVHTMIDTDTLCLLDYFPESRFEEVRI